MEKCCPNPYFDCSTLLSCFIDCAIRVPSTFTEPVITLRFSKPGSKPIVAKTNVIVAGGWAVISTDSFSKGFFNPYAGSYTLEFLDSFGIVLPFIAKDGKTYLLGSFKLNFTTSPNELVQLNFIDNETYP